jgi:LCP family protein required for cell wall assembly
VSSGSGTPHAESADFDATQAYILPEWDQPDGEPAPLEGAGTGRSSYRLPRGARIAAAVIVATIPIFVLVWAVSVVVPIVIEAREAADKIFVTPVDRVRYSTPVADVPLVPESTPTSHAVAIVPTPTETPAGVSPTSVPDQQLPTPIVVTPSPTPYPAWDGTRPLHILLLGVDRRVGEVDPPRSDTMIIMRIDPVAKRVDMVSIPRDLLVDIPGFYATKVNAAYPLGELAEDIPGGGPTLAAQTIEYNFGIAIDYFAEVDIAGMERVVDILGGVIVDVPVIVKDDQYPTDDYGYTRVYFTPGLQRMDGRTAVQYSRTRHDDGDFARQDRQHEVLRAMRQQAEATGVIGRLPQLISEAGDSIRTDLSFTQVLSLARLGQDIDEEDVYSHTLLPYIEELWTDEGFFLVGDWETLRAVFADLPSDPYATNGEEETATPVPPVVAP